MNIRLATDQAAALPLLQRACRFDAQGGWSATVPDLAAGHAVFELRDDGRTVGAFTLGVIDYTAERVIRCGAAGAERGHNLVPAMVAFAESEAQRIKADALVCETSRRGLVRRLQAHGFRVTGFILRKDM